MQPQRPTRRQPTVGAGARPTPTAAQSAGGEYWRTLDLQHENLGAVTDSLAVSIDMVAEDPDDIGARVEMLRILRNLEHLLPAHFEYEEGGGYLAEALAAAPRLTRRAQRLRNQHDALNAKLSDLSSRSREAGKSPGSWKALANSVRKFTYELRHHEREENTLIHDAFMDDLGGG